MEGPQPRVVSFRAPGVAAGLLPAARNAPVVTSERALLVNVPQRFLSPEIRTIFACLLREREPFTWILVGLTSTLGYLSIPLRNPSAFPSPPNTARCLPAPNFWRRKRLQQLNWRLRYQSCIKVATVEFPGLGNVCRLRNRPRLFNDICFHRDLQAGGGVFTTGLAARWAETNNPAFPENRSTTEMTLDADPLFPPHLSFSYQTGKFSG